MNSSSNIDTIRYRPNNSNPTQAQNPISSVPCGRDQIMPHGSPFDSGINIHLSHSGPAFQPLAGARTTLSQSGTYNSDLSDESFALELHSHTYASQMALSTQHTSLIPQSFAVEISQEYTPHDSSSLLCPSVLDKIEILHQNTYQRGLFTNAPLTTVAYHGFSLQCALDGKFAGLMDFYQPVWSEVSEKLDLPSKLAIVLCLPGYRKYSRQVTVLRARMQAPTRGKLASIVAREVAKFLALHKHRKPLRHPDGHYLTLEDLVLIDIQHVSKGSLQPTIGIFRRGNGVSVNPQGPGF